jgi:cell division protein FtsW
MAKRVGVDKVLFCTTLVLVVIGLVMVFSASAITSQASSGSPYSFLIKQVIWAVLGLAAMTVLMQVDYRKYGHPRVVFPLVAITALLLLVVFAMPVSHGAHRWIKLGPFSLQPSEMAKPTIVLFLAWFLQNKLHMVNDLRSTLIPAALPSLLFIGLIIKEPDLGTALVCAGVTALMLYLAGMKVKYLAVAAAAAAPVLAYMLLFVKFRRERLLTFLHPDVDTLGTGYHMNQSLIAVGTGGVFGRGYMEGVQKLFYLPESHTDYIFANISEELGLVGALVVVALFVVLGYRGLRASLLARDPFARFLAFGITTTILLQAFFNISVVLALVPTKGITLPFISYGGTSLFITLLSIGVLLNITRECD